MGILARRGCGKVKHLELKQLWLQEQIHSGSRIPEDLPEHEPQRRSNTPLHERGCEETLQAHEH